MSFINLPNFSSERPIKVLVAVDVSGSFVVTSPEQLSQYKIYLSQIVENLSGKRAHVMALAWDTRIQCVMDYHEKNLVDLVDYIDHATQHGGRGTDLDAVFEYDSITGFDADFVIIFSDGQFSDYPLKMNAHRTILILIDSPYNSATYALPYPQLSVIKH